jgi:hypothetical protein
MRAARRNLIDKCSVVWVAMVPGESQPDRIRRLGFGGLSFLQSINIPLINRHVAPTAGRHGPRVKAKPENPIQVGLWRSTSEGATLES